MPSSSVRHRIAGTSPAPRTSSNTPKLTCNKTWHSRSASVGRSMPARMSPAAPRRLAMCRASADSIAVDERLATRTSSSLAADGGSYSVSSSAARWRTAARRDVRAQSDDPFGHRSRIGSIERLERLAREVVEVGLVALDQLDDDRFLRVEVVVEAPRQDAAGVGDLLQRRAQALRREQRRRGVEDLQFFAPHRPTPCSLLQALEPQPSAEVAPTEGRTGARVIRRRRRRRQPGSGSCPVGARTRTGPPH